MKVDCFQFFFLPFYKIIVVDLSCVTFLAKIILSTWLKDILHMCKFWFALLCSCDVLWEEYDPVNYWYKENKETNGVDLKQSETQSQAQWSHSPPKEQWARKEAFIIVRPLDFEDLGYAVLLQQKLISTLFFPFFLLNHANSQYFKLHLKRNCSVWYKEFASSLALWTVVNIVSKLGFVNSNHVARIVEDCLGGKKKKTNTWSLRNLGFLTGKILGVLFEVLFTKHAPEL